MGGICKAALAPLGPRFSFIAPLSFCLHEYHQSTILNKSFTTAQTPKSGRCLKIPPTITVTPSILSNLLITCGKTVPLAMIGLHSWPGYHPWNPSYAIGISKIAVPTILGNGFYKLPSLEAGMSGAVKVKMIRQPCFAMGVRGSEKHFLGNGNHCWRM